MILKLSQRLQEQSKDKLHLALLELPNFPHLKDYLKLGKFNGGVSFFI
jgi:hypothetical protein